MLVAEIPTKGKRRRARAREKERKRKRDRERWKEGQRERARRESSGRGNSGEGDRKKASNRMRIRPFGIVLTPELWENRRTWKRAERRDSYNTAVYNTTRQAPFYEYSIRARSEFGLNVARTRFFPFLFHLFLSVSFFPPFFFYPRVERGRRLISPPQSSAERRAGKFRRGNSRAFCHDVE